MFFGPQNWALRLGGGGIIIKTQAPPSPTALPEMVLKKSWQCVERQGFLLSDARLCLSLGIPSLSKGTTQSISSGVLTDHVGRTRISCDCCLPLPPHNLPSTRGPFWLLCTTARYHDGKTFYTTLESWWEHYSQIANNSGLGTWFWSSTTGLWLLHHLRQW